VGTSARARHKKGDSPRNLRYLTFAEKISLANRENSNSGPNHIAIGLGNCDFGKKRIKRELDA